MLERDLVKLPPGRKRESVEYIRTELGTALVNGGQSGLPPGGGRKRPAVAPSPRGTDADPEPDGG